MRTLGFPVVPLVLGVVLGQIAEARLSQVFARSDDIGVFLSRPWSLFFLLLACFSVIFPLYQANRGKAAWTACYLPVLLIVMAWPVFLMPGIVRPILAICMVIAGLGLTAINFKRGFAPRHSE